MIPTTNSGEKLFPHVVPGNGKYLVTDAQTENLL